MSSTRDLFEISGLSTLEKQNGETLQAVDLRGWRNGLTVNGDRIVFSFATMQTDDDGAHHVLDSFVVEEVDTSKLPPALIAQGLTIEAAQQNVDAAMQALVDACRPFLLNNPDFFRYQVIGNVDLSGPTPVITVDE